MTLSEWSCGIDLALETYIPTGLVGRDREQYIKGAKEIRPLLERYALNGCFAVTKLIFPLLYRRSLQQVNDYEASMISLVLSLQPPQPMELEAISDDEETVVHVRNEPPSELATISDNNDQQQPVVHVRNEPLIPLPQQPQLTSSQHELILSDDEPLPPSLSSSSSHHLALSNCPTSSRTVCITQHRNKSDQQKRNRK
ncbi:unnamed protein product [Didymodactylos carnosus]|uniref:Uncharacterized protein n=1 Tax=Didymodactylos carnosus TaxID=1234261 RepID=A0A815KW89_9BILA|nr:unnamed protein product [Didymodactylos carnosus]CAF1401142.1 unnamed protein product [Didymodactylos carnosus]CAF3859464.1 unnamed protein product [Didymodactylos carnosus]CAF4294970.1 unnamed protein product [Didymodactylos carnosus]